jgi:hypothetical protein
MTMITKDPMIKPGQIYEVRSDGRWDIFLDATMARTYAACPAMFKESFGENLVPKGDKAFARDLGKWWSRCMEEVYTAKFNDNPLQPKQFVELAMKVWNELEMDELEATNPKQYKEFGGRYGALQMISEYATRQLPIDYRTWKILAAEASFGRNKEVCLGETERTVLYWMGQPDLYVISDGRVLPVDHKSTGYIDAWTANKYKPDVQIPGYIIAGKILAKALNLDFPIDRAIINCVARTDRTDKTDTGKFPRFKRFFIQYTPEELEEWTRRRLQQSDLLRTSIETNTWQWNEAICSSYYHKVCQFRNIHEKTPSVRPVVIAADYLKRAPWIPGKTEKELKGQGEGE